MRLSGNLNEALQLASHAITANSRDWEVMGESIRVLICLGQAETAARLYQAFTAEPNLDNCLPPEALVRLALLLGRRDLLEGMEPPSNPAWLVTLLTEGDDPAETLVVQDVQVTGDNGPSIFTFTGTCPHCGHGLRQEFRTTLLVHRAWVCTSCFGPVQLDYSAARDVLRKKYSHQLASGFDHTDRDLIEHIKPRVSGAEPAPFIVQALAQEYHFLLNEIILKVSAAPDREPAP